MVFVFTEEVCFLASDTFVQAAGEKRPGIGIAFRFQNSVCAGGGSGPRFPRPLSALESNSDRMVVQHVFFLQVASNKTTRNSFSQSRIIGSFVFTEKRDSAVFFSSDVHENRMGNRDWGNTTGEVLSSINACLPENLIREAISSSVVSLVFTLVSGSTHLACVSYLILLCSHVTKVSDIFIDDINLNLF